MSCCLGNVLRFYGQFKGAIERAIQRLVAPVEKEFNVRGAEKAIMTLYRAYLCVGNFVHPSLE